ncbi:MAG: DUF2062 domain-containing protein [Planctomycetota bacterium]|jgi:uncharacterized protein (DUF2062 family)
MPKPCSQSGKLIPTPRELLRRIVGLDDTPHNIALGTAIGMFIGLTPTVGVQMLTVIAFAWLVRKVLTFNRIAAILTVYVTNPVTTIPIYWFNYKVGTYFVEGHITREAFTAIFEYQSFAGWWDSVSTLFLTIGAPLIVGSLLVATIVSIPTYPFIYWLIRRVRGESSSSSHSSADNLALAEPDSPRSATSQSVRTPVTTNS